MKTSRISNVLASAFFVIALMAGGHVLAASPEDYIKNDVVVNGVVTERMVYVNNLLSDSP